ncbi:MAG: sigma-54-dependent transcriptional regulator, partial [bacterium]
MSRSPAMREVLRQIELVRSSAVPVLITGERGSGREAVARIIHLTGARQREPFVQVDCASAPADVLADVLFGAGEPGRMEQARGGTLYLESVCSLPAELQDRLLRALAEAAASRAGNGRVFPFKARVIAATHQDLRAMVQEGKFRESLFRRLSLFPIALPPLRDRREDVPALAHLFLERHGASHVPAVRAIESRAIEALQLHTWPGNVRELENVILSAILDSGADAVVRASA